MPIALLGIILMISGPSMIMAWFKLRQRQLSPILDANGWAVNSHAKVNIPFGTSLTLLAVLPKGSKRSLSDPFAKQWGVWEWLCMHSHKNLCGAY